VPGVRWKSGGWPSRAATALLILVAVGSWWPALIDQARDVDVLLYATAAARANAETALPYTSTWIEKGPLAMGLYQLLFAAFGAYNLMAVALAWLALALGTLWMVAALARAMGGGAWWAAAFFAVALPAVGGSLNTEVPAAAAAIAALLIWCRTRRPGTGAGNRMVFMAGLLAGVAFLCRQNAGILAPILVLAELWTAGPGVRGMIRWRRPLLLVSGFAILPVVTVLIYALAGEMDAFLFCFHGYNVEVYIAATRVTTARILAAPWSAVRNFLMPVPLTALLGLAGMVAVVAGRLHGGAQAAHGGAAGPAPGPGGNAAGLARAAADARLAVFLTAAGTTLSLFAGLRFFAHYFGLALPFWAALAGWFTALMLQRLQVASAGAALASTNSNQPGEAVGTSQAAGPARLVVVAALLVVMLMSVQVGRRPWRDTLRRTRDWVTSGRILQASDPLTWPRRDGLSTAAARYIREHSPDDAKVFVWGMRPHVQVYARRLAATRFVTSTFLAGVVPWERMVPADGTDDWIVPGAWDLFTADMARDKPLFIVDASNDHMFGQGAHPPQRFSPLADLLQRDYTEVARFGEIDTMVIYRRR